MAACMWRAQTVTPSSVERTVLSYWNMLCSEEIPDLLREAQCSQVHLDACSNLVNETVSVTK